MTTYVTTVPMLIGERELAAGDRIEPAWLEPAAWERLLAKGRIVAFAANHSVPDNDGQAAVDPEVLEA